MKLLKEIYLVIGAAVLLSAVFAGWANFKYKAPNRIKARIIALQNSLADSAGLSMDDTGKFAQELYDSYDLLYRIGEYDKARLIFSAKNRTEYYEFLRSLKRSHINDCSFFWKAEQPYAESEKYSVIAIWHDKKLSLNDLLFQSPEPDHKHFPPGSEAPGGVPGCRAEAP